MDASSALMKTRVMHYNLVCSHLLPWEPDAMRKRERAKASSESSPSP